MKPNLNIIEQATSIDAQQRGEMLMESAYMWIERYFGTDPVITNALNQSVHFWKWWAGQWDNRDNDFLYWYDYQSKLYARLEMSISREQALEFYRDLHDCGKLGIVPNRLVQSEFNKLLKSEQEKLKTLKQSKK